MQFRLRDRAGFTLVEIMIVVGVIALLAALALPGMLRARKRAQASRIKDDLRLIEAAVDQYAIETHARREKMYSGTISVRRRSIKSQPSRLKLTPSLPMLPTTDFGPRLPHKTGIVPKFRFDGTQTCQPVRPAGLQPAERNQNLSAG